ncbi:hypothetical protein NIA69_21315 [Gemmiger formicilis]|nr:hypothetical protein [Gemmiger formicilis]
MAKFVEMRYNKGIYQERSLPMYPLIRRYLRRVDVVYLLLCAACSAISVVVLLSIGQTQLGSNNKASVQLIASLLGLMLAVVFPRRITMCWPGRGRCTVLWRGGWCCRRCFCTMSTPAWSRLAMTRAARPTTAGTGWAA